MKRLLIVASAAHSLFSLQLGDAYAAGPYDGEWIGSATSAGGRCKPASVTLTVAGKVVTGQAKFELNAPNINGTVWEDGKFGGPSRASAEAVNPKLVRKRVELPTALGRQPHFKSRRLIHAGKCTARHRRGNAPLPKASRSRIFCWAVN